MTFKYLKMLKCCEIEIQMYMQVGYMLHFRLWLFSFIRHAKDKEVYTMQ